MGDTSSGGFRPDIEGLRGVAVLLVLLFHASLLDVSGGFIGVDVFFVISGFLITGLLVRERERTGTVRFRAFYARRVRRLLPAGLVALVVTLAASFVALAPLDRSNAALDAAAAALSIGNIRFAIAAGDYFASVGSPSPFLHFWSLGVEEQFYLVWPALVLVAALALRPTRRGVGIALVLVIAASLAADVYLTTAAVNWAFYSLPARAWELALGGLLAVAVEPLSRIPGKVVGVAGWAALATIVAAAVLFDGTLPYPGLWALVPTVATAVLIVAGFGRHGPAAVLETPPLRFLGRISYSLYLWHWPILILPAAAIDGDIPIAGRIGLAFLAIGVAWLSWRFVEEPFRVGLPSLAGRPGRTILAGASAIVLVVTGAGGLAQAASDGVWPSVQVASAVGGSATPNATMPSTTSATAPPTIGPMGTQTPTETTTTPTLTPTTGPTTGPTTRATQAPKPTASPTSAPVIALPADVRPPLLSARGDEERLRADGCLAFEPETAPANCVYGDPKAAFTVALVGDSHAAQWFPALALVAAQRDWRILTFVKVACPFLDFPIYNVALKRAYTECTAYDEATIARLQAVKPDLTLVSMSRYAIHPLTAGQSTVAAQAASFARMLARIPGKVAVIQDTPDAGRDIPACLSRHPDDVRLCAVPRWVAFGDYLGAIERAATAATGDPLIDLTTRICRGDPCPVVVDGMIVFRDMRHMTATFSASLAPDLGAALASIVPVAVAQAAAPTPPSPTASASPTDVPVAADAPQPALE